MNLTTETSLYEMAREFVNETSQHVFLTGKAGTGKTTFLRDIVATTHKIAVVAAPTGVAAINAGGVTLHSLFQLPFSPYVPNDNQKQDISHFSKQKLEVIRQMELLIIDEVSMLRSDTLDAIDAVLRRIRRSSNPFGGVQMLYIGDMFQLPPVVKDEEWSILRDYYRTQFFFHAHALLKNPPVYIELKKVYRQQDSQFIDLLNRVRNNILQDADIKLLNSRYFRDFNPPKDQKFITLTTHNFQADKINTEKLQQLPTPQFEFEGKIDKDFPEFMLPCEKVLQLKEGAQIMFVKNDSSQEKLYYNGKIGTITRISKDEIWALCENDSTEIQLHTEIWENNRYNFNKESGEMEEEVLGTFTQYPVRLAWAITVHKSQGLTFNNVILDISRAFAAGQAYVALSRCTTLEGIVFQSLISRTAIQTDPYALELSEKERSLIELENTLKEQKQFFWTEKLKNYFDLKPLHAIFYDFAQLLKDKIGEEFDDAKTLLSEMRKFARSQEYTILKFQHQLQKICDQSEVETDKLRERCQKAVEYFYPLYIKHLLTPLRTNIKQFEGAKKAKTYYKHLLEIEQNLTLFIEKLKNVQYYNLRLVDSRTLQLPTEKLQPLPKPEKKQKGDSAKLSLEMFQAGKTIQQIGEERNLQTSTIMEHLSHYISSGQVSIFALVPKDKVEKILPLVQTMLTPEQKSVTPIKEKLGDEISYDEIRAVVRYWQVH
ncbi:MAG: helix-turn-helix domain-containing protein [Candidatus Symbiothrix sp.]|nr:helix-turn-helix domain-containing protein [Candidatus Symbiothrix sp.]